MIAVIFDLDNTIYDESIYFRAVFNFFFTTHNIKHVDLDVYLNDSFFVKSKDVFGDVLKDINFYSENNREELFVYYKSIECILNPYDDFLKLVELLISDKNIKIGLITNGTIESQKNKVKLLNISKYFHVITYARERGKELEKPNKYSFIRTLDILNIKPSDAFYIGDSPFTDIIGAKNAGIKPVRLMRGHNRNIENYDEYKRINSLLEFKEILL